MRRGGARGALGALGLVLAISVAGGVLLAGVALPVLGVAGLAARAGAESFDSLPSELEVPPLSLRTRILAADGSLIANFFDEYRVQVPFDAIAPVMRQAIVAIEDSRFYDHGGVDVRGTARAFVNNQSGESTQGGSTITQQYVKGVLLDKALANDDQEAAKAAVERSGAEGYGRKLREMRYAVALEEQLTKDQILERYLNIAYFGSGAYGIEAASRRFFSKGAAELTLPEAATLAGLVQAPGVYDPTRNPEAALARRNTVLARMKALDYLPAAEIDAAAASPLALVPSPVQASCETSPYPFFCDYVLKTVLSDPAFGADPNDRRSLLLRGGLTITTTLDPARQQAAQASVDKFVPRDDPTQFGAAIAMVQPGTGAIQAMAQNRTFGPSDAPGVTTVNYAADRSYGGSSGFQAGSTFKVWVLAAAIKQGIPLRTRINAPAQVSIGDITSCDGVVLKDRWQPRNSGGSGTFDLQSGTARSVNTFFAQLEQRTGLCDPRQIAHAAGVRPASGGPDLANVKSFTLGVDPVSPLRMAEGYATFAARGVHCAAFAISTVLDRDGNSLAVPAHECAQVVDQKVADGVNAVLAGVIDGPDGGRTGRVMSLGRPAAGKTGTTNENYDVWFTGYTPDLAAAAWVGDPGQLVDGQIKRRNIRNVRINGRSIEAGFGGLLPGPIWRDAMAAALNGVPETPFVAPDPVLVNGTRVAIPSVAGLSVERASNVLAAAGWSFRVANQNSANVAPGRVIGTNPSRSAYPGDRITLLVSSGPVEPRPQPSPSEDDDDDDEEPGDDPTSDEESDPPNDEPSKKPSKKPSDEPSDKPSEDESESPPPEEE